MPKEIIKQQLSQISEIRQENGFNFYRLKYQPQELWVTGVDIAEKLEFKNPANYANNLFYKNKEWLESESKLINIPTKTGKKGISEKDTLLDKNYQNIRVYSESTASASERR